VYSARITTAATDVAGNPLAADYVWAFTTGGAPDTTAPVITSISPADGDVNVPVATDVTATFNEPLNPATLSGGAFTLERTAGGSVAASVTYDPVTYTATCTPAAALEPGTSYTATITTTVTDASGNPLGADYVWSFTTGGWLAYGGQVDSGSGASDDPTMLLLGATPAVGYRQDSYRTRLNIWSGTDWGTPAPDPSDYNTLTSHHNSPAFCSVNGTIYLAYGDAGDGSSPGAAFYDRVFAHRWTETTSWEDMNSGDEVSQPWTGPLNQTSAYEPAIDCAPLSNPAIAWVEAAATSEDDDLWLGWVTSTTVTRSTPLSRNDDSGSYATNVYCAGIHAEPFVNFVAHWEQHHDEAWRSDLYVTAFAGGFTNLGDDIASDYDKNNLSVPSITWDGSDVYVAYSAANDSDYTRHVYVQVWDGSSWSILGGGPVSAYSSSDHYDSGNPDLELVSGDLYVTWDESNQTGVPSIFVARWDPGSGSWVLEGEVLNTDPASTALDPNLAYSGTDRYLYVAFEQLVSGAYHIFVKRIYVEP
jgi:hypothetical protein